MFVQLVNTEELVNTVLLHSFNNFCDFTSQALEFYHISLIVLSASRTEQNVQSKQFYDSHISTKSTMYWMLRCHSHSSFADHGCIHVDMWEKNEFQQENNSFYLFFK